MGVPSVNVPPIPATRLAAALPSRVPPVRPVMGLTKLNADPRAVQVIPALVLSCRVRVSVKKLGFHCSPS